MLWKRLKSIRLIYSCKCQKLNLPIKYMLFWMDFWKKFKVFSCLLISLGLLSLTELILLISICLDSHPFYLVKKFF